MNIAIGARSTWALLCERLIPEVAERGLARFCDVFIEENAFSLAEGRRILETAKRHGLGLKIHADQLSSGGGAGLAAELGAVSAEHLEYASDKDIAAMVDAGTVAVSLPLASMYLREPYLPARKWIEAGARVAVATDFNPGSAPSYHLHLAMTLACINQQMSPAEVLRAGQQPCGSCCWHGTDSRQPDAGLSSRPGHYRRAGHQSLAV